MNKKNWVDYKEIKKKVNLQMVLKKYGVFSKLRKTGNNFVGTCPIHKGHNDRQFSVNLERNIWRCFGDCQGGGNILDFVSKMENISIHEAGLLLKKWFLIDDENVETKQNKSKKQTNKPTNQKSKLVREEKINTPLKFHLQLIPEHTFFEEKRISPETINHFGLGLAKKGMMKDRIAIPIHNEQKQLIAYCGRATTKEQVEESGKYKLPANFHKSDVVYNLNRQKEGQKSLILVESYLSVFKLYQAGFTNVVSLQGSELSEKQEELIINFLGLTGFLLLMFDNDKSGLKCTENCLKRFGKKFFVKTINFSQYGKKPHYLELNILKDVVK